jgi:hypothetical protein
MKISKDTKEMTVVNTGGSGHELSQNVNDIRNIRTSYTKIDKVANKVTIASGILKRNTICDTKTSVKLHRSVHRAVISETSTIKKIMNVLSLGEIVAVRCGSDLYLKKLAKGTQARHVKLLTKTSLNKGNIVRIILRYEHIIHIEKNKGTTTRGSMNEKSRIMLTSNKSSSNDNRGEALKPSILHVKLRDDPPTNRSHHNKSMDGGPVRNRCKSLLIVMTILLLKTTSNKTRFIALNRVVIPGFDLIDPLARDRNSRRRVRDKIPSVGMLKSSDLLSHSKLPLGMSNNITIGGRLRKRDWRT